MVANEDCGLFIGVDDYGTYDLSMDQPKGRSDLPGSVNDAKAFWRVARWLGMQPENLRVLTSPPIDPAELDGATAANVGEATEAGILDGVRWIASSLTREPGRAALMTYSGHGAYLDGRGLLLCPSDTQGQRLEHAISYSTLRELLGPAGYNLTTVLDCCHSGAASASADQRPVPSLGRTPVPASVTAQALGFAGRVLSACRPQQITQQGLLLGRWHGSFAWALAAAMEQWRSVPDGVGRRLEVSYGELIDRVGMLMKTLSFAGAPLVVGPKNVRELSVMQRGDAPLTTTRKTDATRARAQLDPGDEKFRWYTITDEINELLYANVLVPAENGQFPGGGTEYELGTEYWYNVIPELATGTTHLTFTWTDYTSWSQSPAGMGPLVCTMPQVPRLVGPAVRVPDEVQTFVNNDLGVALSWGLEPTGKAGSLSWYTVNDNPEIRNTVFSRVDSGQTLIASTPAVDPPEGTFWVAAWVPPDYPTDG